MADKSKSSDKFKAIAEKNGARPVPQWLSVNRDAFTGQYVRVPNREDIDLNVAEHLIVELYSK